MSDKPNNFNVEFGKVARTLEYSDSEGRMVFTFDLGSGEKSLCLEHYPARKQIAPRYKIAFERTKMFLESHGHQVEIYGDFANSIRVQASDISNLIENEIANLSRPLKSHFNLRQCLISPKRAAFVSQPENDTWDLWIVFEEQPDKYKIVFDEFSKQFGVASENLFLGFEGTFVQTLEAISSVA
jgi:hypothetical protein